MCAIYNYVHDQIEQVEANIASCLIPVDIFISIVSIYSDLVLFCLDCWVDLFDYITKENWVVNLHLLLLNSAPIVDLSALNCCWPYAITTAFVTFCLITVLEWNSAALISCNSGKLFSFLWCILLGLYFSSFWHVPLFYEMAISYYFVKQLL